MTKFRGVTYGESRAREPVPAGVAEVLRLLEAASSLPGVLVRPLAVEGFVFAPRPPWGWPVAFRVATRAEAS